MSKPTTKDDIIRYYEIAPIYGSNSFIVKCEPQYRIPRIRQYDYIKYSFYHADGITYEGEQPREIELPEMLDYESPFMEITLGKYNFIKLYEEQNMVDVVVYLINFCKENYMNGDWGWIKDRYNEPLKESITKESDNKLYR